MNNKVWSMRDGMRVKLFAIELNPQFSPTIVDVTRQFCQVLDKKRNEDGSITVKGTGHNPGETLVECVNMSCGLVLEHNQLK